MGGVVCLNEWVWVRGGLVERVCSVDRSLLKSNSEFTITVLNY